MTLEEQQRDVGHPPPSCLEPPTTFTQSLSQLELQPAGFAAETTGGPGPHAAYAKWPVDDSVNVQVKGSAFSFLFIFQSLRHPSQLECPTGDH